MLNFTRRFKSSSNQQQKTNSQQPSTNSPQANLATTSSSSSVTTVASNAVAPSSSRSNNPIQLKTSTNNSTNETTTPLILSTSKKPVLATTASASSSASSVNSNIGSNSSSSNSTNGGTTSGLIPALNTNITSLSLQTSNNNNTSNIASNNIVLPSLSPAHRQQQTSSSSASKLTPNNNSSSSLNAAMQLKQHMTISKPQAPFFSATPNLSSSLLLNPSNKSLHNKLSDIKNDIDNENLTTPNLTTPSLAIVNSHSDKISRPTALAPLPTSSTSSSPADFPMQFGFSTATPRTRRADFRFGSEPAGSMNGRSSQLNSATSSDSDKNSNFIDFIDYSNNASGSVAGTNPTSSMNKSMILNIGAQRITPNGLPLNQLANSSSISSSTSSPSLSQSSSTSSLPPYAAISVNISRLADVNTDKFNEISKNAGYLTINNERVQASKNDLLKICDLGSGTSGNVVKMKHLATGYIMAVKQMNISGVLEENKRIIMDLDVVSKSNGCDQIVKCFGYFISDGDVWICMELMSMCFDKLLKKIKKPIPEPIVGKLSLNTLTALNYLKENHHVIHRDVKPSNILINEKGEIKLCDFGISGNLINSNAQTRNNAGCAGYMAPERIEYDPNNPKYDVRADVWSLGISLIELATGEYPYKNCKSEFEVMTTIIEKNPPVLEGDQFSSEFKSFVSKCLTKDAKKRPNFKALLEDPFIVKYKTEEVNLKEWFNKVINDCNEELKDVPNIPIKALSFDIESNNDTLTYKNNLIKSKSENYDAESLDSKTTTPTTN